VLKRIDHVGVIVEDLARAKAFLEGMGLQLERELDLPERAVKAAFYRCGDGMIEMIEPTTDEARKSRLGEGNRARIEHIAIEVDSIAKTLEAVRGLGVEITTDDPVPVGPNLNVWTRPETSEGVQYQILEKNAVQPR
jgi:methylmalonyl-CoA/ethylmalonyl-CoA epimerase